MPSEIGLPIIASPLRQDTESPRSSPGDRGQIPRVFEEMGVKSGARLGGKADRLRTTDPARSTNLGESFAIYRKKLSDHNDIFLDSINI
jgi:hypothetical protein